MNRYFCVKNVVVPDVVPMDPWTFDVSGVKFDWDDDPVKSKARYKKEYFKNPKSRHCLFAMAKGVLPSQAISANENPTAEIFGIVGDYDATVGENIIESLMDNPKGPYLPTRWSETQGRNFRLVWEFESGVRVESNEHATKLLKEVYKRVGVPKWGAMCDMEACCNPAQHFDVGRRWGEFSDQRIPLDVLKVWDYEVFTKIRSSAKHVANVPMEEAAKEANRQFPGRITFPFVEGGRCNRFWDPASDNMDGCVITKDGVRVFVPHDKPFMSWGDILGMKFVDKYTAAKVSPVVQQVWFNNRGGEFVRWKDNEKKYVVRDTTTLRRDLAAEAGLSPERKKGELLSEVDIALHDITTRREVDYAAPVLFFPHGPMFIDGGTHILNTSTVRVMSPSDRYCGDDEWKWSNPKVRDAFPFIYGLVNTMFEQNPKVAMARISSKFKTTVDDADNIQLQVFLSWLSAFYSGSALLNPTQGQCLVVAGPSGVGKSFLFNNVIGPMMGGALDADQYYVEGDKFTGSLFNAPIHLIDDKICDLDHRTRTAFTTRLKVVVATARLRYEEKYRNSVPSVPWLGRVVIACNMDPRSLSILPDLEQSNADKITMLKTGPVKYDFFPNRADNVRKVKEELPRFARFVLEYKRDLRLFDKRMGVKAYQHPDMRVAAAENGYTNVVVDALRQTIDSLVTDEKTGKVKSGVEFLGLVGSARYIYDRISDVSQSAARDIGGARQLAAQLGQMETRGYNLHRRKQRGSWVYEIPSNFDDVAGAKGVGDAVELEGVIR